MSRVRTLEATALQPAFDVLAEYDFEDQFSVLEEAASRLGGWDCGEYRSAFRLPEASFDGEAAARELLAALDGYNALPFQSLAALSQPVLDVHRRRSTGAYYTDFRLAAHLAQKSVVDAESTILDPAAGTGVLLVAAVQAACGADRRASTKLIANGVSGADLDELALRGARLALASLCNSVDAVLHLDERLRVVDSILAGPAAWGDVAPDGFDLVIANPPWGKVKLSRHEHLRSTGVERHYGHDYGDEASGYDAARMAVAAYAEDVGERYSHQGRGEVDLFKVFLELGVDLTARNGVLAYLLPAGLIRSAGCKGLRKRVWSEHTDLEITVIENRARFFAIDTRFKFLSVVGRRSGGSVTPVRLEHASGTDDGVNRTGTARLGRKSLQRLSPSLAVPEVRSADEWRIWTAMAERGRRLGDPESPWCPSIVREVDMTRDRERFAREDTSDALAVAEGRMVAQHRFGAKAYRGGTGRSARWEVLPFGSSSIEPQFWIRPGDLPTPAAERFNRQRIGFCDITGQTNERTFICALVPAGVVCGNKVPTVEFADPSPALQMAWLAVSNSIPFDWWCRRVVTTTVNFFLLRELPFPDLDPTSLPARHLADLAGRVRHSLSGAEVYDPWRIAEWRAEIDCRVLLAFRLEPVHLRQMLCDFPLFDRHQPPLPDESHSTVTRDLLLATAGQVYGSPDLEAEDRLDAARAVGALAFVPAECAELARITSEAADVQ